MDLTKHWLLEFRIDSSTSAPPSVTVSMFVGHDSILISTRGFFWSSMGRSCKVINKCVDFYETQVSYNPLGNVVGVNAPFLYVAIRGWEKVYNFLSSAVDER